MKNLNKIIAVAAVCAGAAVPAMAQNVGISIGVNQPGVYGRIDIGNAPQPLLVYPQPVIIQRPPQMVQRQPIYLYVPPTQQQNWGRYCSRYSACNQPVYFVQEQWVRERYERAHPGRGRGPERWDDRRDGHPGRGNAYGHDKHDRGHGHGNGRDHDRRD